MAQELLATFAEELGSVTLTPDVTGGFFEIRLDGEVVLVAQGQGALSRNQGDQTTGPAASSSLYPPDGPNAGEDPAGRA